jgi:hypothetical protein
MKKLFLLLFGLIAASYAFAVTPADPTNVTWYDCGDESGHSYLTFTLPTVDVDGNPLDIEMMGYRIYTDYDQIVSFNSTVYDNVWGTTTDIYYYNWEAGSDLQSGGVYFYRTNADGYERFFNYRIGIQVFYLNSNFTIGDVSNIVYTELETPVALPKPANPSLSEFIDYGHNADQGPGINLGYDLAMDFDGNLVADDYTIDKYFNGEEYTILDPEKVSFSIFTDDDQIFTFTPEAFPNAPIQVTEPMTQFPYNGILDNGSIGNWDIHFTTLTNEVEEGEDPFFTWRIGIQTHYTDAGQTNSSDIVYMEIYPQLQEAKNVTSTSFLADWSCDAENTFIINNFIGEGCGYFLYVVDKETQEVVLTQNVAPANTTMSEWGYVIPLPGATYAVEGLTPGGTYEFYVEVKQNTGKSYQSVVREVTLPQEGHGYELGDVNHDEAVNIGDVTALIDYLLGSGSVCEICANVNGDEGINIGDVTALIDKLLSNN